MFSLAKRLTISTILTLSSAVITCSVYKFGGRKIECSTFVFGRFCGNWGKKIKLVSGWCLVA